MKNKFGYPVNKYETVDPVPMVSKVAFKKPLSAQQRVLNAIRQHDAIRANNALPGDDTFDGPDLENMTPHQLMTDPKTGEEMTAGEYVMLEHERKIASDDVQASIRSASERKKQKKLQAPPEPKSKPEPSETDGD